MAKKRIKTRYVEVNVREDTFVAKLLGGGKEDYDFSDLSLLRKLLSNEKGRILHILKKKQPTSIYGLAKELQRDFKSVYTDLKVLERFGFIEFHSEKKGKRPSLKPILLVDELQVIINI